LASRRRRRKSIGKVIVDVERRVRRVEKRPGAKRLKRNVVTTEKLGFRAVTTKVIQVDAVETENIATDAVTANEVEFGVTVVSDTDPAIVKEGTTVVDPDTGSTKVYSTDIEDFVTLTDPVASEAASDAFDAATAALDAVDGKNSVFRQDDAPTGGTYVVNDVWIDTNDGNKLYVWTGTAWVSAQDAGINAAQTTANGKNKVTYSTSAPGSTANTVGDIWFQFSSGIVTAQYIGAGGTSWTQTTIGSAVIANLDAGKITTGLLNVAGTLKIATGTTGARVEINPTGFFAYNSSNIPTVQILAADGSASFTGSINVGSSIAGTAASTVVSGATSGASALQPNGTLTGTVSSTATIAGTTASTVVSGASEGATALQAGNGVGKNLSDQITSISTANGIIISTNTSASGNTARVEINNTGFFAYNGTTQTVAIQSNGSASFTGTITSANANITGTVNATSGYLGSTSGWNFSSSGFLTNTAGSTILYPSGNTYALITDREISGLKLQANSTASNAISTSGGVLSSGSSELNTLSIVNTMSIFAGYGVTSDWSPNTDNQRSLGQAVTTGGAPANRRWQRLYSNNTTISTSDARLKTDIDTSTLGLDFINALRPVSYRWIVGKNEIVVDEDGKPVVIGHDENNKPIFETVQVPGARKHYGFIAQEVQQAVIDSGVDDFAGWVQDDLSDPESFQSLSYEQFIAPLVKALQEASQKIASLELRIKALE
jgi:hypothetical protein